MLAFLPALASAPVQAPEVKPQLPVFKRRWWHRRNRLDARPVMWSLKNHPEEWRWDGQYLLEHQPSKHTFWIFGLLWCRLWEADCSCHGRSNDENRLSHQLSFYFAVKQWKRWHRRRPQSDNIREQFASHFIHE